MVHITKHVDKKKDHALELLNEMIENGNKNFTETTCDIDRIRGEEHFKAQKEKKKAKKKK